MDVWYDGGMCCLRQELRKASWRWHSSQHLNKTRHRLRERLGKNSKDSQECAGGTGRRPEGGGLQAQRKGGVGLRQEKR